MTVSDLQDTTIIDHIAAKDALPISDKIIDEVLENKIVSTLNVPDLPIELWIEILSHLPPGFVRKLIGINRYLFERGMDEIYEEVRVTTYDRAGLKTFEQLRYPSIAHRARKLCIQPDFLPLLDSEEGEAWSQLKVQEVGMRTFLETALEALVGCSRLHELTIVLCDQYIPKSFSVFLENCFEQSGSRIHSITIDMTCSCFIPIRDAFLGRLPNLSSLTVNMACPALARSEVFQACHALTELIMTTKRTLRSLALSEFAGFSFSHVFRKLNHLPLLDSLEVQARYGFNSLTPGTHLWSVIESSNDTLQRLVIKQSPSTNSEYRDSAIRLLFVPLFSTSLSNLHDLVLELEHRAILPKFIHFIPTFAPHLRRLSLLGRCACLAYDELQSLLGRLLDAGGKLEHLQISAIFFSPDVLQLLYASLPKLKILSLCYEKLGNRDSGEVSGETQLLLYDAFRVQEYPEWKVEELELLQLRRGPDNALIRAIVESLPSLTRVVRSWDEDGEL